MAEKPCDGLRLGLEVCVVMNFTQVSLFCEPLRRIDGLQYADPSSKAGGTLSEFQKSVPDHVHCWVTP